VVSPFARLLLTAVLLTLAGPARADALDDVRARGELVWGGDLQGGEPYVFEDPGDPRRVVGFEVDLARAIAHAMGLGGARFQQVQWSNLVPALERGDVDVALNGLEDTPERRDRLLLSRPYFVFREVLAVRRGSPYRTLDDLRGRRVGTLNQTYALEILRKLPLEPALYEGQAEPYADLQSARVDAVLLDHVIADRYGCPLPGVECLPGAVARGGYVAAVRRGEDALARAVDGALARVIEDGELRGILSAWKLWSPEQESLSTPASALAPAPASAPAPAPALDRAQVILFLQGAALTVLISASSFAIAMPLGLLLGALRFGAGGGALRTFSAAYVEIFRGTPVLLQLYLLYFGLAPYVRLGPMTAAVVGLGLNYAAYEAEVYRGAMIAVPRGQTEAAAALGFGPWQTLRHVIVPQALRTALPAATNDLVSLLKDSSLVSVLTVVELTKRMTIASVETRSWLGPGLLCAALYFVMSFPLSILSRRLERGPRNDPHPRLA
jgi:polar amino acid transport system substrate-binding protein